MIRKRLRYLHLPETLSRIKKMTEPKNELAVPTDIQMLIETRLMNEKKSTLVAYLLWLFLGTLGIHHFYMGNTLLGIVYIILGIIGWGMTLSGLLPLGGAAFALLGIGLLLDLFRIPSCLRRSLADKREKLLKQYREKGSII